MGQEEESLAFVGEAHAGRGEQTPLRIPPVLGKVGEDGGKPRSSEAWDVLNEKEGRAALPDDAAHGRPEPPLVGEAAALAGDAEGLAGDAASDEIHDAAPRSAVEGSKVIPDRRVVQATVRHARRQNAHGRGLPLHVSDGAGAPSGSQAKGEVEPAVAGADGQHVEGR